MPIQGLPVGGSRAPDGMGYPYIYKKERSAWGNDAVSERIFESIFALTLD